MSFWVRAARCPTLVTYPLLVALAFLFLCEFMAAGVAWAGDLAVDPIRLDLSAAHPITALSLRNNADTPTLIQVTLVRWAMDNGREVYTPSDDLLATPPIFTIPPHARQIVRVGLRRPTSNPQEQSYRLFLQEPPRQKRANGELQGLRVALRIGVPVFVAPAAPAQENLQWRAVRIDGHAIRIEVSNLGNVHARLRDIRFGLQDSEQLGFVHKGPAYLLAGGSRHWLIHPHRILPHKHIRLSANTAGNPVKVDLEVADQ